MIAAGLLWYDDDVRRPLAIKLAEASERYRERVGYEPTTCLLNPAQIPSAPPATGRGSRKKLNVPAITLQLVSDEHLRPNYFFVGVGADERPRRVRGWQGDPIEEQPDVVPTRRARRAPALPEPKPAKRATATRTPAAGKVADAAKGARADQIATASEHTPAPVAGSQRRGSGKAAYPAVTATPSVDQTALTTKAAEPAKSKRAVRPAKPAESAVTTRTAKPAKPVKPEESALAAAASVTSTTAAGRRKTATASAQTVRATPEARETVSAACAERQPAAGSSTSSARPAARRTRSKVQADSAVARAAQPIQPPAKGARTAKGAAAAPAASASPTPQRRRKSA